MLLEGPLYRHGKQWRQIVLKFPLFYRSLGSRRPPRRVRAYNSTNNHELNNTPKETRQNI